MHHTRTIGRLLVGVLAALMIAVVGLATPALADEASAGTETEPLASWANVRKAITADLSPIWVSTDAPDAISKPITIPDGGNFTINIMGNKTPKAVPAITIGATKGATLAINIKSAAGAEVEDEFTNLTFGNLSLIGASILSVDVTAPELSELQSGTITLASSSSMTIGTTNDNLNLNMQENALTLNGGTAGGGAGSSFTIKDGVTLTAGSALTVPAGNAGEDSAGIGAKLTIDSGATLALGNNTLTIANMASTKLSVPNSGGSVTVSGTITSSGGGITTQTVSSPEEKIDTTANNGTLTLNGATIGVAGHPLSITNNGTMTGSATIYGNVTSCKPTEGTGQSFLEMDGGSITGNGGAALIVQGGTATLKNVKLTAADQNVAVTLESQATGPSLSATLDTCTVVGGNNSTTNANSGIYIGSKNNSEDKTTEVNIENCIVTGGTGSGSGAHSGGTGINITASEACTVNISGGTISGGNTTASQAAAAGNGLYLNAAKATVNVNGTTTITGGSSSQKGSSGIVVQAGSLNINSGTCTVNGYSGSAISLTGGTTTIKTTVKSNSSASPLVNVSNSGKLVLGTGANLTNSELSLTPVVSVGNGASLSMNAGTIASNGPEGVGLQIDGGSVKMDGGNITGTASAVAFTSNNGSLDTDLGAVIGSNNTPVAIDLSGATEATIDLNGPSRLMYKTQPFSNVSSFTGTIDAAGPYSLGYSDKAAYEKAIIDNANLKTLVDGNHININENATDPGLPNPPEPPTVPVLTYYEWSGATSKSEQGTTTSGDNGPWTFEEPTAPSRPGYVFLGWFTSTGTGASTRWTEYEGWGSTPYTSGQTLTVTGIWAQVQVALSPTTQAVAPGASVTITATPTISLADGVVGTGVTAPTSVAAPTVTATPTDIKPTVSAGTTAGTLKIAFTAPATQPATVTVAVSYRGATSTSASGYATATVNVADASVVKVAPSSASMGTATASTINDNGTVTLTATPAKSYEFTGWTFTAGTGVTWKPSDSGINVANAIIEAPTYAGSWTANFQEIETVAVYRLYNKYDYLHLYTSDQNEINTLKAVGWTVDFNGQPCWTAPAGLTSGGYEVLRYYNRFSGDHYFVKASDSVQIAQLEKDGWTPDGGNSSIWSAAPTTANVEVYTLFNPYNQVDTHLYTANKVELATLVRPNGWEQQDSIIWGMNPTA